MSTVKIHRNVSKQLFTLILKVIALFDFFSEACKSFHRTQRL